jgi:hypothetical protein
MATATSSRAARMNAPGATLTNGRYELPPSARGVLVLADPPELGWRMETRSSEGATAGAAPLAAPGDKCDRQRARDECVLEAGGKG